MNSANVEVTCVESPEHEEPDDLFTMVARYESRLIDLALIQAGGNRTKAAAALGIPRTTLVDKMARR